MGLRGLVLTFLALAWPTAGGASSAARAECRLFVLKDCPIANQYAPEIRRLIGEYGPKGIRFTLVYEDADITERDAAQHEREFGINAPRLLDPKHELARAAGASVSPTAVLTSGRVIYSGRIDDAFASLGKRRAKVTSRDLRAALNAFLAGREAPVRRTTAVGCKLF